MLVVAPEVQDALRHGKPVVALESTIIAHGIPRPRNYQLAMALEDCVREQGATPATIAVIDGELRVGLDQSALERIANSNDFAKCSTRDLSKVMAECGQGATTIAATIFAARKAGLRFMATGGLGGVHPGGETSMDISADIGELARSPMCVVCSGPKVILDLPRTMECLETQGVSVVGFQCDLLPGFYISQTGIEVPKLASVDLLAKMMISQEALGWPGSIVVANPPPEKLAFDPGTFARILEAANAKARANHITGAALTPFLLAEIATSTGQKSVTLNEELVKGNARLAAQIATQHAKL